MKHAAILTLLAALIATAACSRSPDAASAQPTPRPNLRADADRLQNAINKAAEQRKQQSSPAPTASPAP
jgi:hypothetical protein